MAPARSTPPQNPRLVLGEEVVDGLAAQRERTQVFPAEQAMLARPVNDNYNTPRKSDQ
jgi:hypothetical protein